MDEAFLAPARSWPEIERIVSDVRAIFGIDDRPYFPVMEIIEKVLPAFARDFHFFVGDAEMMQGAEGLTHPCGAFIMLSESVYRDAWAGRGRARFTASHELGHWFLHAGAPLRRLPHNTGHYPRNQRAEPQADHFAASILMPRKFISFSDTPALLMQRFGVSRMAAENRLSYVRRRSGI